MVYLGELLREVVNEKERTLVIPAFCLLIFSTALAALSIFTANSGVQSDEWTYMKDTYFYPIADSQFGTYLFQFLFMATSGCSAAWYTCVKSTNFLFVISIAFILGISTWVISKSLYRATVAAGLAISGPFLLFAPFFMPETTLTLFVSLGFLFVILGANFDDPKKTTWMFVVGGLLFGLASLAKVHFMFPIFGLLLMGIFLLIRRITRGTGKLLVIISVSALLSRILVGLAVAGQSSLNLFAGYSGTGQDPGIASAKPELLESLGASFMQVLPFVALLAAFGQVFPELAAIFKASSWKSAEGLVLLIGMLIVSSLVAMTAAFAFILHASGAEDVSGRFLTRYWEYALLLLIPFMLWPRDSGNPQGLVLRITLIVTSGASAALTVLMDGATSPADSAILSAGGGPFVIAIIVAASVSLIRAKPLKGLAALVAVVILGVSAWSSVHFTKRLDQSGQLVGKWIYQNLRDNPDDLNGIMFVGKRTASYVAAFHGQLPNPKFYFYAPYSTLTEDKVPPGIRWIVASEEVFYLGQVEEVHSFGDQVVFRLPGEKRLDPKEFSRVGIESRGRLGYTAWGAWVLGDNLELRLPSSLGRIGSLELGLVANDEFDPVHIKISFQNEEASGILFQKQEVTAVKIRAVEGNLSETWITLGVDLGVANIKKSIKGAAFGLDYLIINP